ncbi:MAG TPA: regulatory protein RecX [Gammaproteobacteria bacterium]|nr:regulatory protein RecX [Gammaproteobacteria bacterium]
MPEDRPACRRRAMDLLARREHSRLELEQKLAARSFDETVVAHVLDELEREGLLSADRFVQSFVEARYARGQGPSRIRRELAARGIESAAANLGDERFDWDAKARETRVKRFGEALPSSLAEKARQIRFLEYRGFSHDQIRRALEFDDE